MKTLLLTLAILFIASQANALDRTLTWIDNSNNEKGFILQSCPGTCGVTGVWTQIAQVGADTQTLVLKDVQSGVVSYRVAAFNEKGVSAYTNIITDTVPMTPNAPTTLTRIACTGSLQVLPDPKIPDVWNVVCVP